MTKDSIQQELWEVRKNMEGISPRLEIYKKFEKRRIELENILKKLRYVAPGNIPSL